MTDEEKAEEYVFNHLELDPKNIDGQYCKQAYLDGLVEGRKEATEENFKEAYQRYVNNSLATFDMKKALEDTRDQIRIVKENEQLKTENEQIKKNWHDCFLSCSSPYCAAHFPAVKMEGELGNMSKYE